jgi:hypothetical protein
MSVVSNTSASYSLFRRSALVFLRSAARLPELWSDNSAIMFSAAVQSNHHEIRRFVHYDTVTALVLGIPPLIHYDTSPPWTDAEEYPHVEWVSGVPIGIILQVAKINSWRVSHLMGQSTSDHTEWREVEARLQQWNPTIDYTFEPPDAITRVTVQEAWRQAVLIYLYMVCSSFKLLRCALDKPGFHSVCAKQTQQTLA